MPPKTDYNENRCPAFLGIGAQRSGTTWLYSHLYTHPETWLPPIKELHYFDMLDPSVNMTSQRYRSHLKQRVRHNAARLIPPVVRSKLFPDKTVRWNPAFDFRYFFGRASNDWYVSLFKNAHAAGRITGEISPAYSILSKKYINEIYQINPRIKIIFILRNPILRSWSHAVKGLCMDRKRSIAKVGESEFIRHVNSTDSLLRSDYLRTYQNWTSIFPRDRILICYHDRIVMEPNHFLMDVCRFLGVDPGPYEPGRKLLGAVNSSAPRGKGIPAKLEHELARIYLPRLEKLSSEFPGYPEQWYQEAKEILSKK